MTELIWDGKYVDGKKQSPVRVALPFQTIETVNESTADRLRTMEMFASGRESEWRNRLIWGDKKYVLPSLLPEFAGKVNLIYIDPPFDTGADFSFTAKVPSRNAEVDSEDIEFIKEPSIIEQKAYRDTWGRGLDSYLSWFFDTAVLLKDLLSENGSIYVHLDAHIGHYAKAVLDEVFGAGHFRSEIIWKRTTSHSDAVAYGSVHDTILFYAAPGTKRNVVLQDYDPEYIEAYYRYREGEKGRRFMSADLSGDGPGPARSFGEHGSIKPPSGRHWMYDQTGIDRVLRENKIFWTRNGVPRLKKYLDESPGMPASDVWDDIQAVRSWHKDEATGYATQKPETLLDRVIIASSDEGDLVLDCFSGSGTTASSSEKLKRRWIACDLGRFAVHTARKRLLAIPNVKPFVVQNLGKYERQQWQVAEFPSNGKDHLEEQRQREAAYRQFILELYHMWAQ
jgi:adenine-specific DNA-methyltransferase